MQQYQRLLDRAYEFIIEERHGAALQSFNQAYQLKPDETQPLVQMALLFSKLGDAEGAADLLRKAAEIDPGNANVLLHLGLLQYENGRLDEAEASLQDAVEIIDGGTRSVRARLMEGADEGGEAIRAQCDDLDETADYARELLREIRKQTRGRSTTTIEPSDSRSSRKSATVPDVERVTTPPLVASTRGERRSKADLSAKEELLESAAKSHKLGRTEQAMEYYERVLTIDEEDFRARLNIASILNDDGRREEALRHVVHAKSNLERQVQAFAIAKPQGGTTAGETHALLADLRVLLEQVNRTHDQIRLRLMFADSAGRRIDRAEVERRLPTLGKGKRIRIGVLVTLWKRHALADLVLSRCRSIRDNLAPIVELELMAVGSEGEVSRSLAERNGFGYLERPNNPLGAKRNAGLRALKRFDLDAVAFVDSDDFVNERLFTTYAIGLQAGYAVLGLLDMYVLDLDTLRACYWPGYGPKGGREGETLGLGRCVNRALLDRLDWKLWDDTLNRRLDGSMIEHLASEVVANPEQFPLGTISIREHDVTAVDVKTGTNLWSFDHMIAVLRTPQHVPPVDLIERFFTEPEAARMLSMSAAANQVTSWLAAFAAERSERQAHVATDRSLSRRTVARADALQHVDSGMQNGSRLEPSRRRRAHANHDEPVDELISREELEELRVRWGNPGWAASLDYLYEMVHLASRVNGPILECGSGLTTIVLGLLGKVRGMETWSLEHDDRWYRKLSDGLDRFGLHSVNLCHAPLKMNGDYAWYDAPLGRMPDTFALVVCDGPPGNSPGGRYGLLPEMAARLSEDSIILIDDVARPGEREALRSWREEYSLSIRTHNTERPFGVIRFNRGPQHAPATSAKSA